VAQLLFRLGEASARRAWAVVASWCAVLGIAGAAFLIWGGTLTDSFSIPGTETERVTQQLATSMPQLTGSSATVVFATEDGSPFTAEQRAAISWRLLTVADLDGVVGVSDPFAAAADRAAMDTQLTEGGEHVLAAFDQLDESQAQIATQQEQLDLAVSLAKASGTHALLEAEFASQQAQLDAALTQVTDARAQLAQQSLELAQGRALLDATAGLQTVSADGSAAVGFVSLAEDQFSMPDSVKEAVAGALTQPIAGVEVGYSTAIATGIDGLLGVGEIAGLVLAALVLLVMLRTAMPAMIPLINSLIGVGLAVAAALALSGSVDMSSVTPILGVMLGLAVGIDYALFIVHRHRRQLLAGADVRQSIALANGTAGNAVVFAGTTVVVALVALCVTGVPFLAVMGFVAAWCVLVAVVVSVTLTPALLSLIGLRVVPRGTRARLGDGSHAPRTVTPMSTRRAVATGILGTVGLLVVAIPALSMRLGLPDGSSESPESAPYRAQAILAEKFGAGMNGPLLVVATTPDGVDVSQQRAFQVDVVTQLMAQEDVVAVAPAATAVTGDVFAFQVIPSDAPSSVTTQDLVHTLRQTTPEGPHIPGGTTLGVAGQASGNIDISAKLSDAVPLYLAVVVGLSMLILLVVFRSVVVPILATGGFVLSVIAAFGAMTAVYQWGWLSGVFDVHAPGPVLSFAPILIMGVLFGLAMDYQLFLGSGMREAYVHGLPARHAVVAGVRLGRSVVIAAAIIMISVFGGFVFSHLGMVRPLGFGLAVGVLCDAFVVRLLLMPSAMHLLGDKAWWLPRWLERVLPQVDVEGAALERSHPLHVEAPQTPQLAAQA